VESDFAEIGWVVKLGMKDIEGDRIAMVSGEFRGHVVIVDKKFLIRLRDFVGRYPRQRHRPEVGGGEDGVEFCEKFGSLHDLFRKSNLTTDGQDERR
jgi:hypothetical protein